MLQLDHVMSLSEIITPLAVGIVLGCLVVALLVLVFTHRWWGLVAGILLLSAGIGVAAVIGVEVKQNTSTTRSTEVLHSNRDTIQAWAAKRYQLKFSAAQATELATGTESYVPTKNGSQQFGTVQNIQVTVTGGAVTVPVTLFYDKGDWALAYTNASGKYTRVPVVTS